MTPERSRVVLVGVSRYAELDDVPAVENNIARLRELFTDPDLWGLPDAHCVTVLNDDDPRTVPRAIREAARAAGDLLLVYYVGHGLLPYDTDQFCLALPSSTKDDTFTALRYEDVRRAMATAGPGVAKAVILDCCFAARALEGALSPPPGLDELSRIEGACMLTAADETTRALAPPGERYTAFTGELIHAIENGVPDAPDHLDLGTLHRHVATALEAKSRPRPQFFDRGQGRDIRLVRNRHRATALSDGLRTLVNAQLRAADDFPYRLVGARRSGLSTVYVRQEVTAHAEAAMTSSGGPVEREIGRPVQTTVVTRAVEEAIRLHSHLVVTGGPGQGKSTLTLQLTAQLAQALTGAGEPEHRLVPVRVTAAALATREGPLFDRLREAAAAELGLHLDAPLPAQLLHDLPDGWSWLVVIDGLDEITDPARREFLIRQLAARMRGPSHGLRLLITSRPLGRAELDPLRGAGVGVYELEPFGPERLRDFARRWFGDGRAEDFLHAARQAGPSELVRVPLLATITAIVYEQRPGSVLPGNRYLLYRRYLSYLRTARAHAADEQWRAIRDRVRAIPGADPAPLDHLRDELPHLLSHLADAAVEGSADLASVAIRWSERHGGGDPWIPEWPDLVAGLLDSTGLFVHATEGQRFIHHSFAEHLAGESLARRLPQAFDPDDPVWADVITAALEDRPVAMTALIAHASAKATAEPLLEWLEGGDHDRRLLAGGLLAEGIATERADEHVRRFLAFCDEYLRVPGQPGRSRQPLWDTIGRLGVDTATRFLSGLIDDPDCSVSLRVEAATALPPAAGDRTIATLRAIIASPETGEGERADAARSLARLGPSHIEEAVKVFRDIIASPRTLGWDRASAADDLATASPDHVEEAAGVLLRIATDPKADFTERCFAARWLAECGPVHAGEAATVLRELISMPGAKPYDRASAARELATLGPEYTDEATLALRAVANDRENSPNIRCLGARWLSWCGPSRVGEATAALRALLREPGHSPRERIGVVERLSEMDPAAFGEWLVLVRQAMADPDTSPDDRIDHAISLAWKGPDHWEEAASGLRGVLGSPHAEVGARALAARFLAHLIPGCQTEGARTLHGIMTDEDQPPLARRLAAEYLEGLGPRHAATVERTLRAMVDAPHLGVIDRVAIADSLRPSGSADEGATIMREAMNGPGGPADRAYAAFRLASRSDGVHHGEAVAVLRGLMAEPPTKPSDPGQIARWLIDLRPDLREEAVEAVRDVMVGPHGWEARCAAAADLAVVTEGRAEESAEGLRRIVAGDVGAFARWQCAEALHRLGAAYREEAIEWIRPSLTADTLYERAGAANRLGRLDQSLASEGAEILREVIASLRAGDTHWSEASDWIAADGDRRPIGVSLVVKELVPGPVTPLSGLSFCARNLAHLSPRDTDDAAEILRRVLTDAEDVYDRAFAADRLAGLSPAFVAEGAETLAGVPADTTLRPALRALVAGALARRRPSRWPQAAEAFREIIADPRTEPAARVFAATELASLGHGFFDEAMKVMDRVSADPHTDPADRVFTAAETARRDSARARTAPDVVRAVIASPHSTGVDRALAAAVLAELSLGHPAEASAALEEVLAAPGLDAGDRGLVLLLLGEIAPRAAERLRSPGGGLGQ
ncbi:caspase, EACC1-associated type [Thermomonospora umbrina]|uniref:Caspase domain-containing protein n=1 Tax=Thermomonospora umbrina TaxID=111806 RepID=A0A3D9SYR1_9ACTN|nr:caspase family protein [Thermomonospora umbrina]REE99173.1 caspase domain-containing protein [Thermomonospora umbrina]